MIKADLNLQTDVIDELAFEPSLDATYIGVTAKEGVVTLTGTVRSYAEKRTAEHAVKRVLGVRGIAEELLVEIPTAHHRSDADIAQGALAALDWDVNVPKKKVTVKVEKGWLTLEGQLDWPFQRDAATRCVEYLMGVHGLTNAISVKPPITAANIREEIYRAFERNAEIDADKVQVEVVGDSVTLRGNVRSWTERGEATYAASSVPGVKSVHNETLIIA